MRNEKRQLIYNVKNFLDTLDDKIQTLEYDRSIVDSLTTDMHYRLTWLLHHLVEIKHDLDNNILPANNQVVETESDNFQDALDDIDCFCAMFRLDFKAYREAQNKIKKVKKVLDNKTKK